MELVLVILALGWFFILGAAFGEWLKERKLKKEILSKENVIACFKDVDWGVQTFGNRDGSLIETSDGTKHFYKVHSIDKAIKKLNKLMQSSPAEHRVQADTRTNLRVLKYSKMVRRSSGACR